MEDTAQHSYSSSFYGKPSDWFSHIVIVRSDVQREFFVAEDTFLSELECIQIAETVQAELQNIGIRTSIVVADDHLTEKLLALQPDLCFNFTDSIRGNMSACAGIPTIFDLLEIPYVGASTLSLSLNCNKFLTKTILEAWDIPTPQYQLMRDPRHRLDYDLRYPLICKLNEEHGGVGISGHSVVTNEKELRSQVSALIKTYQQAVLVEEYIEDGQELSALVLEQERLKVLFSKKNIATSADGRQLVVYFPSDSDSGSVHAADPILSYERYIDHAGRIRADVRKAFEVLRIDDIARMDIMLDKYGNHFIIDVNSNPALSPDGPAVQVAQVNGMSYRDLLISILRRNMMDKQLR